MAEQQTNLNYTLPTNQYTHILEFIDNMIADGQSLLIDMPQEINGAWVLRPMANFLTGKVAMQVTKNPLRSAGFPVGVVTLPHQPGLAKMTPFTMTSIGIPKAAKHKAEAWRVIRFLMTPLASELLASRGWLPAAHLSREILTSWSAYQMGNPPVGIETLLDIYPSVANRRLEQLNSEFWYFLSEQAEQYFRGRTTKDSVLNTIAKEQAAAKAKAAALVGRQPK